MSKMGPTPQTPTFVVGETVILQDKATNSRNGDQHEIVCLPQSEDYPMYADWTCGGSHVSNVPPGRYVTKGTSGYDLGKHFTTPAYMIKKLSVNFVLGEKVKLKNCTHPEFEGTLAVIVGLPNNNWPYFTKNFDGNVYTTYPHQMVKLPIIVNNFVVGEKVKFQNCKIHKYLNGLIGEVVATPQGIDWNYSEGLGTLKQNHGVNSGFYLCRDPHGVVFQFEPNQMLKTAVISTKELENVVTAATELMKVDKEHRDERLAKALEDLTKILKIWLPPLPVKSKKSRKSRK
jgi:hypothetical protein